jgi:glycosyltransferase involved in cell wall biosynthesis
MPRVDVVLPNLNKAPYIEACLDSLVEQTYPHWRCIVVDGDSDDGSWETLRRYAQDDDRFELHQPGRLGLYPSWNYGLDRAQAPYVAILTSDDVWEPTWLAQAVEALERAPTAVCAAARPYYMNEAGEAHSLSPIVPLSEDLFDRWQARGWAIGGGDAPGNEGQSDASSGACSLRWGPAHSALVYAVGSFPVSVHALVMRTSWMGDLRFATDLHFIADREWHLRLGLRGDVAYCRSARASLRQYVAQATSTTRQQRHVLAQDTTTIVRRNAEAVRRALGVTPSTFEAVHDRVVRYTAFQSLRPSLEMVRAEPRRALRYAWQALQCYPRLMMREVLHMAFTGRKYSLDRRMDLAHALVAAAHDSTAARAPFYDSPSRET